MHRLGQVFEVDIHRSDRGRGQFGLELAHLAFGGLHAQFFRRLLDGLFTQGQVFPDQLDQLIGGYIDILTGVADLSVLGVLFHQG